MGKKKRNKGQFKKGHKPWNKGKKIGPNKFNRFMSEYMKEGAKKYRTGYKKPKIKVKFKVKKD